MERPPVIFLAFANNGSDPLPSLEKESGEVYGALMQGKLLRHYEVEKEDFISLDKVKEIFRSYKDRIIVFHYGGHADPEGLFLSDARAHAAGLAEFLSLQPALKLVFINGCATQRQVEYLRKLGIPAVIATRSRIDDSRAAIFAGEFYKNLATGYIHGEARYTLAEAFDNAASAERLGDGNAITFSRGIKIPKGDSGNSVGEDLWVLDADSPETLNWRLPNTPYGVDVTRYNKPYVPRPALVRLLFRCFPFLDWNKSYYAALENKPLNFSRPSLEATQSAYVMPTVVFDKFRDVAKGVAPGAGLDQQNREVALLKQGPDRLFLRGFLRMPCSYVLLMGDTGAGKTAFLQGLFCDYARTYPALRLAYVYAGNSTLEEVATLPEKGRTVLFLDALDEDDRARGDLESYIGELSKVLKGFANVIISCRIQLFKNREEEWSHLNHADFFKVVLSGFSNEQAEQYLKKKYRKTPEAFRQALKLFNQNREFFKRPLILSRMDELLEAGDRTYDYLFEVYEAIVGFWAEREERVVQSEKSNKRSYARRLIQFSKDLALFLFQQQQTTGHLLRTETLEELASAADLNIEPGDARSRSFLTRERDHDVYAFTHRSFPDYFLATLLFEGRIREEDFPFEQYPETERFYTDMCWLHLGGAQSLPRLPTYKTTDLTEDTGMRSLCGKPEAVIIPNRALRAMLYRHRENLRSWKGVHDWLGLVERLLPLCSQPPAAGHYIFEEYKQFQKVVKEGVLQDTPPGIYLEHFLAGHIFREVQKTYGKGDFWTEPYLHITIKAAEYQALLPAAWPHRDFGAMLGVLARNPLFKERLGNLETITLNGLCIEDTDFLRHCSFKLTNLDLSGNLLHQLPQALPQLRNLCSLHLDENQLQLDRSMLRPTLELPELQSLSVFGNPAPTDFPIVAMGRQKGENVLRRLRKEVLLPPPMIQIPGGTFGMGQPDPTIVTHYDGINTLYSDNEQPVHLVMLSDFCLGKYAVTLGEFRIFIEETRYLTSAERNGEGSYIWDVNRRTVDLLPGVNWRHDAHGKPQTNERHPVLHVSWYDAVAFCNWLSRREGLQEVYQMGPGQGDINNSGKSSTADWMVSVNRDANGYRLPTEAEWEFAARERGREVLFGNGKNIANPAEINFNGRVESEYSVTGEYRERTVPVGSLQPNALLLYEMSGNVGEWCQDWYGDYSPSAQTNPQGPDTGSGRVIRGGSWHDDPQYCRVADRSYDSPGYRTVLIGFRLSRTL